MKKIGSVLVAVLFLMVLLFQQAVAQSISASKQTASVNIGATTTALTNIIPKPVSVKEAPGVFTFYRNTIIETPASLVHAKQLLQSQLSNYNFAANKQTTTIKYILAGSADKIAKEGYTITIAPNAIIVKAKNIQGALLASQSVLESFERQFNAGRKTWLDLMTVAKDVAQNEMQLAELRGAELQTSWHLHILTSDNYSQIHSKP